MTALPLISPASNMSTTLASSFLMEGLIWPGGVEKVCADVDIAGCQQHLTACCFFSFYCWVAARNFYFGKSSANLGRFAFPLPLLHERGGGIGTRHLVPLSQGPFPYLSVHP